METFAAAGFAFSIGINMLLLRTYDIYKQDQSKPVDWIQIKTKKPVALALDYIWNMIRCVKLTKTLDWSALCKRQWKTPRCKTTPSAPDSITSTGQRNFISPLSAWRQASLTTFSISFCNH